MDKEVFNYLIKVPEGHAGDVMGQLTVLDVILKHVENDNGILHIRAQSTECILSEFSQWLRKSTNGDGSIEAQ